MDGQVIIGTSLDTKELERQLKEEERLLNQFEKEEEKLLQKKAKLELDTKDAEEGLRLIEQTIQQLKNEIEEMSANDPNFVNSQEYLNKLEEIKMLEQTREDGLEAIRSKHEEINNQIEMNKIKQGLVREEVEKTNNELSRSQGLHSMKDLLKDIGKDMEKNVKKVGQWMLALIGVRAVYGFIKSSINTIASNDDQLKADLDYIKTALAYTIEPLVRRIIDFIKQLLQYLGYIVYMWTGYDIFKNTEKGLKKTTAGVKELKKQLSGFDEANVLSDSSSGGGGGGTTAPSFQLGGYEDMKPPEWLQWIVDHSQEILAVLGGIVLALTLMKLGIDGITALGFGVFLAGIVYATASLLDYLKDPTWENFGKIIIGIGVAIIGLGIIFGALPVVIAGVCVVIVGIIIRYWDKIKEFLQNGINWLTDQSDWVHEHLGDGIGNIYDFLVECCQNTLNLFDDIFKSAKQILDGIIDFIAGVFTGDWNRAFNGLKNIVLGIWNFLVAQTKFAFNTMFSIVKLIFESIKNTFKSAINFVIDGINKMINGMNKIQWDVPDWIPVIGGQKWGVNIATIPRLAQGGIVNNPGKGVMMGNYIAGENREAVLPLTNPTTMAQLGEQIGKWVNLAIDNKMVVDGRVLASATNNQINKENFLMNR